MSDVSLEISEGVDQPLVGALFYGLYLPTFFLSLKCLVWEGSRFKPLGSIHWLMLFATLMLWIASTIGLSLEAVRSRRRFENIDVPNWLTVMKPVTTYLAIFIGDSILIYRCWVVWFRNFYVIIPSLLMHLATTSCALVLIWIQSAMTQLSVVSNDKEKPFLLAYTALAIPFNVMTTALTVFRIWKVDRMNSKYSQSNVDGRKTSSTYKKVMRIFIESGILVTITGIIPFITYAVNSNSFYPATTLEVRSIGIAFNLIIIRAHNQSETEYSLPIVSHSIAFNAMSVPESEMSVMVAVEKSINGVSTQINNPCEK